MATNNQPLATNDKPGPVPFDESYWVVRGTLMAGRFPGGPDPGTAQQKIRGLLDAGIRHIVNLMQDDERDHQRRLFVPYDRLFIECALAHNSTVSTVRFPIADVSITTSDHMVRILDDIDLALAQNKPVYVHCWGGRGRTGIVIGCWLARHGYASGHELLDTIEQLRSPCNCTGNSPETYQQCNMITNWNE